MGAENQQISASSAYNSVQSGFSMPGVISSGHQYIIGIDIHTIWQIPQIGSQNLEVRITVMQVKI